MENKLVKENNNENDNNNNENKKEEVHYYCRRSNPPLYDSSDDELYGITKVEKKKKTKGKNIKVQKFKNGDIRQYIKIIKKNNT
jgi:hypothetical protein